MKIVFISFLGWNSFFFFLLTFRLVFNFFNLFLVFYFVLRSNNYIRKDQTVLINGVSLRTFFWLFFYFRLSFFFMIFYKSISFILCDKRSSLFVLWDQATNISIGGKSFIETFWIVIPRRRTSLDFSISGSCWLIGIKDSLEKLLLLFMVIHGVLVLNLWLTKLPIEIKRMT